MVVDALTHIMNCFILQVRAAQASSLIWELMLYEFKLGHDTVETIKNICCKKNEGAVNHRKLTRWFKKFCSGCKNLNKQARSNRPKTMDSEDVFQAVETNLVTLGEYQVSSVSHSPVWFITFTTSAKVSRVAKLCLMLPKYCKTFDSSKDYGTEVRLFFSFNYFMKINKINQESHLLLWLFVFYFNFVNF